MDKANTRSGARIQEARDHRDLHMQTYLHARTAMIALGVLSDADGAQSLFPPLSLADTSMNKECANSATQSVTKAYYGQWVAGWLQVQLSSDHQA